MILDRLDKALLQSLASGVCSYEELAKECGVTRNTIYRRIALLEKNEIIQKTTRSILNYEKMGINALLIGIAIAETDFEEAFNLLKDNDKVKLLWHAFGQHNIVLVAFCSVGEEGKTIQSIKSTIEQFKDAAMYASIGYVWGKFDLAPFEKICGNNETHVKNHVELTADKEVLT